MTTVRQSDRRFGFMFSVVFAIVVAVAWFGFDTLATWAIVSGGVFGCAAVVAPWILMPLNRLWGRFGVLLGTFNNYLLLGLFFCLFVWPAGIMIRLLGHDPMCRGWDTRVSSYLTPVTRQADAETVRDLF
jgi:hypothetical protein